MPPTMCWVLPGASHYHHARIQAFAERHPGATVVLNLSDTCGFQEFAFRGAAGGLAYRMETLFRGTYFRQIPDGRLRTVLYDRLDAAAPDVVAVQGWSHGYGLLTLEWAVSRGVRRVVMSESQRIDFARARWKEAVKRRLIRLFQAGLVGGMTHADYLAELGLPGDRIFFGYDVVDNDHFRAGADAARAAPRPPGLPAAYFLASSRLIERKNLLSLLDAYAAYRARAGAGAWDLVILGDGVQRGDLERRRDQLGLGDHVHMPGFKPYDELPTYYALAGAFVLPSNLEQWGLVVNEAMAAGLPVIVSDRCGCAVDLVEEGRNGFRFPPADAARLAELLARVAGPSDRAAMGRRSREIIATWSPARFADGLTRAVETARAAPAPLSRLADLLLVRALLKVQGARVSKHD
jgi:glycosyltransferase involved in cell wall biosynthesis